jgi:hypothetical protein
VPAVSAFKEHFLDKYFGYRRRYVDHIVLEAPWRASLAVLSEVARLAFEVVGNALCAVIFWVLAAGAAARAGGLGPWPLLFGVLACVPSAFAEMSSGGFAAALRDRRRVQEHCGAEAKARRHE